MSTDTDIIQEASSLRHYLTEELQLIYALMAKIFDTGTSFVFFQTPSE